MESKQSEQQTTKSPRQYQSPIDHHYDTIFNKYELWKTWASLNKYKDYPSNP